MAHIGTTAALGAILGAGVHAAGQATFRGLDSLTASGTSVAAAISADGATVVGWSSRYPPLHDRAFRWTAAGGMQDLGILPGTDHAEARAVNADGSVVVGRCSPTWLGVSRAFRWTQSRGMEEIDAAPGFDAVAAFAVSADGEVVVGTMPASAGGWGAFRWTRAGGTQPLANPREWLYIYGYAISADGQVAVGGGGPLMAAQALVWAHGAPMVSLGTLPGLDSSGATAISADGAVIAGWSQSLTLARPLVWRAGVMQPLPVPGEWPFVDTRAISADGGVIGGLADFGEPPAAHAVLWDSRWGPWTAVLLGPRLEELGVDLTCWRLESVSGLSADGRTITGTGWHDSGFGEPLLEAWVAHVPSLCYTDCSEDGALSAADFACFQTKFVAGNSYADCNTDGALTVADFGCFQAAFVAGCP